MSKEKTLFASLAGGTSKEAMKEYLRIRWHSLSPDFLFYVHHVFIIIFSLGLLMEYLVSVTI
jgi:hypothetical protein